MTRLSNWKEESDLFEVVTGKMTDEKALKKVDEKKGIKNKIVINPKLTEAIKNIGGELISIKEQEEEEIEDNTAADQKKKQVEQKQKRAQMIKKQVLMKKLIAVRQGSEDIVASHQPKGEVLDERLGGKGYKPYTSLTGKKVSGDWEDSDRGSGNKAKKRAGGTVKKKSPTYLAHVHNKEEVELDELNRYGKETGKATGSLNKRPGTAVKRGGGSDKALNFVRNMIRKETGKPAGQQKKVKGEKGRVQYGDRKTTPADSIAKRRQSREMLMLL